MIVKTRPRSRTDRNFKSPSSDPVLSGFRLGKTSNYLKSTFNFRFPKSFALETVTRKAPSSKDVNRMRNLFVTRKVNQTVSSFRLPTRGVNLTPAQRLFASRSSREVQGNN